MKLAQMIRDMSLNRKQSKVSSQEKGYDDFYEKFEKSIKGLFEESKVLDREGRALYNFTNPDSGKEHYLTGSQAEYIKQQIEANAMHNSFLDSIGMGHLCHRTTSYFQDLDSIIDSMERMPGVVDGKDVEYKVDKGFLEFVDKDGNVVIPKQTEVMPQIQAEEGRYSAGNSALRVIAAGTALVFGAGCVAVATRQPSYFDKHSDVLKKQYTADDIAILEKNFKANPLQYSQAIGDMLLRQMHQKSPEFALEFAQTPEIVDGIDVQEAKAMDSIYGLIKGVDMPRNLFAKYENEQGIQKILIEWEGNSSEKTDWSGFIPLLKDSVKASLWVSGRYEGEIINAKPISFEAEDKIDYEQIKEGILEWKSKSNKGDKDGIMLTFKYPYSSFAPPNGT